MMPVMSAVMSMISMSVSHQFLPLRVLFFAKMRRATMRRPVKVVVALFVFISASKIIH